MKTTLGACPRVSQICRGGGRQPVRPGPFSYGSINLLDLALKCKDDLRCCSDLGSHHCNNGLLTWREEHVGMLRNSREYIFPHFVRTEFVRSLVICVLSGGVIGVVTRNTAAFLWASLSDYWGECPLNITTNVMRSHGRHYVGVDTRLEAH
jgi:hypothetical protein